MSLGELYLDIYDMPAVPKTRDTYFQVYAVVRAILDDEGGAPAAQVAAKAARDASAQYLEQELTRGGGHNG